MVSKKNVSILGMVVCLFFLLSPLTNLNAADTTIPFISSIDEILKANPMEAGKNVQLIKIAETVSYWWSPH